MHRQGEDRTDRRGLDEPRVRGAVKSLGADASVPAQGVLARGQQISSDRRKLGSARGESRLHGHLGAGESRWHATSPAHPLAVAVQKRINPEAFLQGGCPPQSPRLPEPFLPQQCEDCMVCLALHARGEETEIPDVVPVAVGHVVGERGQELSRRVGGLDGAFRARVLRHKPDFLNKGSDPGCKMEILVYTDLYGVN